MAITLSTVPQKVQPVYNPIYYRVTSNNVAQQNFNYVFDIYTGTTATTLVNRYRLLPRPDTSCVFSPARILESYLGMDFNMQNTTGGTTNSNHLKQYYIYFGEEYGSLTTGVTMYSNLNVSSGYTYNGVLPYETIPSWKYTAYTLSDVTKKLLTNSPSELYIGNNDRATLSYLNLTSGDTGDVNTKVGKVLVVTTYQNSGGTLSKLIYIPNSTANTTASKYMHVGTGTWNLNNIPASLFTFGVGSLPVVNTDTDYKYEVYIGSADSPTSFDTIVSEVKTYNLLPCSKYETKRLMFLNPFGSYDYFSFTLVSRSKVSTTSKTQFKKNLDFNYAVGKRGQTIVDTLANKSVTVNSNWITEEESVWLSQLVHSNDVYEIQSDGTLLPILITDTEFEQRKTVNDKIFNCVINYSYAFNINTQRG